MLKNLGYDKPLFILPFDHRGSFEKAGFEDIPALKQVIYEAFKKSLSMVPSETAAILIDEQYGDEILKDAKQQNFTVLLTIEKSGQEDFVFEYGEDFATHIEKYSPDFAKALIKVESTLSDLTKNNLRKLSDYCHSHDPKFLLEIVTGGNLNLILKTIVELQDFGIEPDVWKVEGMENELDYRSIVQEARRNGREKVSIVILGRGEEKELVEKWIKAGSKLPGVIGFAVGRTVFWQPLVEFNNGKMSREEVINMISENFIHFYKLFIGS